MEHRPFEYFEVAPLPIKHLGDDEVLELARCCGSIGQVDRTWTLVRHPDDSTALAPTPSARYLYRGQTARHVPAFPLVSRGMGPPCRRQLHDLAVVDASRIVVNMIRADWFASELHKHPAFRWAAKHDLQLPVQEFAQHYGLPTFRIDMSESVEVALFFATHEQRTGIMSPRTHGKGILYRVDRQALPPETQARFSPLAVLPFARPFRQWAWVCNLALGECFESCPTMVAVEFEHSERLANEIRQLAEAAGPLFPHDPMADLARSVTTSLELPRTIAQTVCRDLSSHPSGLPGITMCELEQLLAIAGYLLSDSTAPLITARLAERLEEQWVADLPRWESILARGYKQVFVHGSPSGGLQAVSFTTKHSEFSLLHSIDGLDWS